MGRVEDGQAVHDLGVVHCGSPGDGSAPVMADQQRRLGTAFLDETADVGGPGKTPPMDEKREFHPEGQLAPGEPTAIPISWRLFGDLGD
jgi:hypothetical protein